jgi:hypothetical protein
VFKSRPLTLFCLLIAGASAIFADELGVGSMRDEVLAQLGNPKSKLSANGREILGYPNGRITLIDGKVASIDWKGALPMNPPALVGGVNRSTPNATGAATTLANPPAPPVATAAFTKPAAPREAWTTDFAAAQAEAEKSKRRLLVLFTGSDWCPACMQFEANVAHADDFLNVTRAAFVLVKLDFPRGGSQSAAERSRNEELRRHYGVNSYPSLLVISADGAKSARVETGRPRQASDIVDFYVQAVDEARRAKEKSSLWPW